jgi:hypothetical protein
MLPVVQVQEFNSEFLDEYGDIKSEMNGIKQQIHRSSTNGLASSSKDKYDQYRYGNSSNLGASTGAAKEPTMPWLRTSTSVPNPSTGTTSGPQQNSSAPVPVPVVSTTGDKKKLPNWLTNSTGPTIPEWQRGNSNSINANGAQQQNGSGTTSANGSPASTSPLNTNNNNNTAGDSETNGNHSNNFTSSGTYDGYKLMEYDI